MFNIEIGGYMKYLLIVIFVLIGCAKKEDRLVNPAKPMFSVWNGSTGSFDFTWGKIGYDSGVSGQYKGNNCVYNLKITGDITTAVMNYTNGVPIANCPNFHINLFDDGTTLSYCDVSINQCLLFN